MDAGTPAMFASADAYDRHVGRYGRALSSAHIAAAGVRQGDLVLDVGCGPGALTHALAEITGPERVAAVDPSAAFVEACRARVVGADVRLGSAEELPDFGRAFDVVMSQLVVNFMHDAAAGIGAMRSSAREGGTVASCVWDYADGMTMLRAFWDAALEIDPEAPDEGRTMRYCTPEELRRLWEDCGLAEVRTGELQVEAEYAGFEDLWAPFPTGLAPSGAYCASLDPERRGGLHDAFFRRLGEPRGSFTLRARAWFVRGNA
jgi:SAM-dependent methyltransferase